LQSLLTARRSQDCEAELWLIAYLSGKQEIVGTDAHGVQSLRIVETQETVRKSAVADELRCNRADVPPGALHAASRKNFGE
jgi:hypothetical protein